MATAYLARKLMTLKLDKGELDKIKLIRRGILKEKRKVEVFLKEIVSRQQSGKTCRLCLRPGDQDICCNSSDAQFIAKDIKYVTGIEVLENDGKPQHICKACMQNLQIAVYFKKTAEVTQWRLEKEHEIVNEKDEKELLNTPAPKIPPPKIRPESYFVEKASHIVREWKCKECKKTFQNEANFTGHVCVRTCNYMCEVCGSKHKTIGRLKSHRLTHHKGERAHKCRYCSFSAHMPDHVRVHERRHTGDRPLQCNVCSCTFTCASTLWKHRKTHEPPKLHCKLCPQSFRYKQSLRDHVASHHIRLRTQQCNFCDQAFITRTQMLLHERRVHERPSKNSVKRNQHFSSIA